MPRRAVGATALLSSVAVAATGAAVGGGMLATSPGSIAAADVAAASVADLNATSDESAGGSGGSGSQAGRVSPDGLERRPSTLERAPSLSRSSDRREAVVPAKEAALSTPDGVTGSESQDLSEADPRSIARALMPRFGFSADQFGCLDSLYVRESGWDVNADNPTSSAYGIPQALPGSKMASAGADWETNPVTQIEWGLGYIQDRYGSPCGAWAHSQANGWY